MRSHVLPRWLETLNREANAFGACSGVVRDEIGVWQNLFGIWYLVFDVLPGFHNNIRNVGLHVRR